MLSSLNKDIISIIIINIIIIKLLEILDRLNDKGAGQTAGLHK